MALSKLSADHPLLLSQLSIHTLIIVLTATQPPATGNTRPTEHCTQAYCTYLLSLPTVLTQQQPFVGHLQLHQIQPTVLRNQLILQQYGTIGSQLPIIPCYEMSVSA
jgi:hypothetical protein